MPILTFSLITEAAFRSLLQTLVPSLRKIAAISAKTSPLIVAQVFDELEDKYSVDGGYFVLDRRVKDQFKKCVRIGIDSFLRHLQEKYKFWPEIKLHIVQYIESPAISAQISCLLDPGSEIFDKGEVTQELKQFITDEYLNEHLEEVVFDAWNDFLKAYSFASRSSPALREFIRASYEAGSFRTLSNIEDSLNQLGSVVDNLSREELTTEKAIKQYIDELNSYRNWALSFQSGKLTDD